MLKQILYKKKLNLQKQLNYDFNDLYKRFNKYNVVKKLVETFCSNKTTTNFKIKVF